MESDDEVKGEGNSYDFGARIYDPRVGRWLSRDALADKYPDLSPYNFVANNPLVFIDPDGNRIVAPVMLKNQARKVLNDKISNLSKGTNTLFKPVLRATSDGEIEFSSDKDMNRAKKFIKRNYNSKNENKRKLATIYDIVLSEEVQNFSVSEEFEEEYKKSDRNAKSFINKDIHKLWTEELDNLLEEKNPNNSSSNNLPDNNNPSVSKNEVIVKIKSTFKKIDSIFSKKENKVSGPKKSSATGFKVDENGKQTGK